MRETRLDGSPLLEAAVEGHLNKRMKQIGGRTFKFAGVKGMPDRIVVFPFGRIYFVELKRKGKKPEPAQVLWHQRAFEMGQVVHVIDTREMVDDFIKWVRDQPLDQTNIQRVLAERAAMQRRYKEEE